MKKIAEMLYQTYEKSDRKDVYSQGYNKVYDKLRRTLNRGQSKMLLDLECEFIETYLLRSIDIIQYMLELIHPENE